MQAIAIKEQKITLEQPEMVDDDCVEISEEPIEVDLTEDLYVGDNHEDIVQNFVCMICYGIVFKPVKCLSCETLYCGKCVKNNKKGRGDQDFDCLKNCGSTACTDKLVRLEKKIMNQLLFSCQNDGCEEQIKYSNYINHLEKECKVLRYQSIFLNGEQLCEAQKLREIQIRIDKRIAEIGHIHQIEDKADWEYVKPWYDEDGPIRKLQSTGINSQSWTMETAICCENAQGSRIISWMRYGSGFEWIGPNKNGLQQQFQFSHGNRKIGKDIEINKFVVLGLQWEPFSEIKIVEGRADQEVWKVRVRSFINREFDAELIIDIGTHKPSLEYNQEVCIGDTSNSRGNDDNCKFQGSIDYVKIWKRLDVGPYAPKSIEEKKDEETKEDDKKEQE